MQQAILEFRALHDDIVGELEHALEGAWDSVAPGATIRAVLVVSTRRIAN
jgi:hypothetical protein